MAINFVLDESRNNTFIDKVNLSEITNKYGVDCKRLLSSLIEIPKFENVWNNSDENLLRGLAEEVARKISKGKEK